MNILIISSSTPVRGGVATYMEILLKTLKDKGYNAQMLNILSSKSNSFSLLGNNMLKLTRFLSGFDTLFKLMLFISRLIIIIRTRIKCINKNIDIIHTQDINSCNAVYRFCRKKHIRLILTIHGYLSRGDSSLRAIKNESKIGKYVSIQEIKAFNRSDFIITVSKQSMNRVIKYVNKKKVAVFRNFIDGCLFHPLALTKKSALKKQFNYSHDDFILLYAGRLSSAKGTIYIIEALNRLDENYRVKLVIAGDGPEFENLKKLSLSLSLSHRISFLGDIARERLITLYQISDGFIMSSVSDEGAAEGAPMALLEAMACGLPIITTKAGGINEIVSNKNICLITEERNSDSIAGAIKRLYDDPLLRSELSANALKEVDLNYSNHKMIDFLLKAYKGVKTIDKS